MDVLDFFFMEAQSQVPPDALILAEGNGAMLERTSSSMT